MTLMVFMVIASAVILRTQEFFLCYKPKNGTDKEMPFYVVMTVLIAAVSIYLVAHWTPSGGNDD
jgi:hypothetical protein